MNGALIATATSTSRTSRFQPNNRTSFAPRFIGI
jgi:hypothetical protein